MQQRVFGSIALASLTLDVGQGFKATIESVS
jgi:hypothetical protein